jgi:hypothetical protein
MTMALHEFQLVLLRRPPDPREYDDETSARIQRDHLAYYAGFARIRCCGHQRADA